mmetsp:Transcript_18364/g.16021  ORF Transcript_18364/g.16021 Transcript_18364/m.16021 type:complete len:81 (+) Transcript_18364:1319-1561(+)
MTKLIRFDQLINCVEEVWQHSQNYTLFEDNHPTLELFTNHKLIAGTVNYVFYQDSIESILELFLGYCCLNNKVVKVVQNI